MDGSLRNQEPFLIHKMERFKKGSMSMVGVGFVKILPQFYEKGSFIFGSKLY